MPDLLHECWEEDSGGCSFGLVSKQSDDLLLRIMPAAHLGFSLSASSRDQSMQLCHERLGLSNYDPGDEVPEHFYTNEEFEEQQAYLKVRKIF